MNDSPVVTETLSQAVERQAAEIKRLRSRLKISIDYADGIQTGYGEDEIDRLQAEIEQLREDRREMANTIEGQVTAIRELHAEIERLRKALLLYAYPEKVKPGAVWNEDYPGGITYSEGGHVYLDNGDMAREALGDE